MVLHVPFRRWVHVKHQNPQALHGGFYCLFPIQGRRVIAVVARYQCSGQLEYKAFSIFVREYRDILGLGDNLLWAERDDIVKWLDAFVHNSFTCHNTPGVERCWYIKHMSQLYVFAPTMTQYLNVQGIAKVTDFAQSFYYLTCSICKRATNAYGNGDFWCNYCAKKCQPQQRSNSISKSQTKLGKPRKCIMTLKVYMHNYAGHSQIKFNVHSMSVEDLPKPTNRSEELLALPRNTPNKKSKRGEHESSSSTSVPTTEETLNSPSRNK